MSLAPSSSSPLATSASAKVPFKNSIWRPVLACGGALGFGLLVAPLLISSPKQHPVAHGLDLPEINIPSENTLIVQPSMPPGELLRGRIKLVADVMGKAPVSGAVARQVVEPGTSVKKGDPVLEISSGAAERAAPAAEAVQNRAEQSQIAAADAQSALGMKINIAQSHLRAAQERVDRAQAQVSTARDLVRRLQNGETVALSEIPAPYRDTPAPTRRTRRRRAPKAAVTPQPEVVAAQAARDALRDNARDLQAARQALVDAQKSAKEADDNLKTATQNVATVEARFDQKKANGADVEVARGTLKDAENTVNIADRALVRVKLQVSKLEANAADLQKAANKTPTVATAPTSAPEETVTETVENSGDSSKVTLSQAIKFASSALDESRRASRVAEKLHSEIEDYQSQVNSSKQRIETATKALSEAQQEVLDSVPRPRFTSAVAPADGVVTWVSRLAREVGAGQSVFGIARGTKVEAEFKDKAGLWRGVKPGTSLSAIVATAPVAETQPKPGNVAATLTSATPANNQTLAVKVKEVSEPEQPGEEATIAADVVSTPATGGSPQLAAGTEILAAVARPGQKPTISVPLSSLVKRGDTSYVAVLSVLTTTPAASAEKENKEEAGPVYLLRWQEVKTGREDGIRQEIVSGLTPGTRVISLLEQLNEMGLTPDDLDSSDATPALPEAPNAEAAPQIAVRLTSA